jgi:hypothetical protein
MSIPHRLISLMSLTLIVSVPNDSRIILEWYR